jgi:uncharacterized protein YcbK (DUF882 family)
LGDSWKKGDGILRLPTAPLSIVLSVGLAAGLLLSILIALPPEPAQSREPDRTLKLFFGHTGERGAFTFKRNGRYDRKELEKINSFLRDWRKTESTRMDPQLLDLVWEIYREAGSHDYIHVVSAYRSPATNDLLRRRSRGVAKNSQHTRGKAMDFALTDVPLGKLRAIAMKKQSGGVGYYPSSGYPFVHVDTGSVRAWPRMSRQQLLALFPKGETLHLPADGKPLPGYERAVARRESSGKSTLAYLETEPDNVDASDAKEGSGVGAWLKRVFPGNENDGGDAGTAPADTQAGGQDQLIAAADGALQPRVPRARPRTEIELAAVQGLPHTAQVTSADAEMIATLAFAPLPRTRPDPVFLAASLGGERTGTNPLPLGGDVIARLASLSEEPAPANEGAAAGDPVALAFASLEDAPELPSEEDSAVIAAFAALRAQSGAAPGAVAYAMAPEEPRPVTLAAAPRQAPTHTALETGTGGPATGVVLAPDGLPSYRADQDAMRNLITTPANYDPQLSRLEMPVLADASLMYRAPDGADAVTDLSDQPTLPVDHFAPARPTPAEQGFFMRLFASLIE